MLEVARELARFVNDLKFENIPTEVIDLKDGRQITRQVHLPKGEFYNFQPTSNCVQSFAHW